MANLPHSGQPDSMDGLPVTREEFRLGMQQLLQFLGQGLGGVQGTYSTQDVQPGELVFQGEPKLAAGAIPPASDNTERLVCSSWVKQPRDIQALSINGGQLAGLRNILINGDLSINQRDVLITAAPVGSYGPDRWKRTAGGMTQIIEAGNFIPGATYTLSGTGVTTQQLTAPTGTGPADHWTLPDVPITAKDIQLELGTVATPYEHMSSVLEILRCYRYYQRVHVYGTGYRYGGFPNGIVTFPAQWFKMRTVPTLSADPSPYLSGWADACVNPLQKVLIFVPSYIEASRLTQSGGNISGALPSGIVSAGDAWLSALPVILSAEL